MTKEPEDCVISKPSVAYMNQLWRQADLIGLERGGNGACGVCDGTNSRHYDGCPIPDIARWLGRHGL
jgi:hypothetical protein